MKRKWGRRGVALAGRSPAAERRRWPAALCVAVLVSVLASCGSGSPPAPTQPLPLGPVDPTPGPTPISRPTGAEPPVSATTPPAIAQLALRYQPTVRMSILDGFWPVSVAAVLQERGKRPTCLMSGGRCVASPPTLAELKPNASPNDYLDYPAPLDDTQLQVDDVISQFAAFERGLGAPASVYQDWPKHAALVNPFPSAQLYFYYDTSSSYVPYYRRYPQGSSLPPGLVSLQYWFFYPLNYYPTVVNPFSILSDPVGADLLNADYHEGDWEHVTVLLDHAARHAEYLYLARHDGEGTWVRWSDTSGDHGHPTIYPAVGGHPSYTGCGIRARAKLLYILSDYVACHGLGLFTFSYSTTPLVDLRYTSWGCWPGHFGTAQPGLIPTSNADLRQYILVAGPRSPLRQQENRDACIAAR